MTTLEEYRKKIDATDSKLIELLAQRLSYAQEIGKIKEREGLPVYDPAREQRVLEQLDIIAKEKGLETHAVRRIYIDIMQAAKRKQVQETKTKPFSNEKLTVAFQGTHGAYSELAVQKMFPNATPIGYEKFEETFEALLTQKVDMAIIPVENSTYGSVLPVYDILLDKEVVAVAEFTMQIEHCLLGIEDSKLETIKEAYSHYQALAQCKNTLSSMRIASKEYFDTAGAAEMVTKKKDKTIAAIASEAAATVYGLKVLKKGVNDNPNNITRFLAFVRQGEEKIYSKKQKNAQYKTSIVFSVPHVPGSLFRIMKVLADHNINLTKIESRPSQSTNWEYLFYIDFIGNTADLKIKGIIKELGEKTQYLRIIGCYPIG